MPLWWICRFQISKYLLNELMVLPRNGWFSVFEMISQLSNKYLVKKLVVYLDHGHEAGMLLYLYETIDQLSNKYLLNTFMVYFDYEIGMLLDLFEMLSNKYLLKINGLPGFMFPYGGYDLSVTNQVLVI